MHSKGSLKSYWFLLEPALDIAFATYFLEQTALIAYRAVSKCPISCNVQTRVTHRSLDKLAYDKGNTVHKAPQYRRQ